MSFETKPVQLPPIKNLFDSLDINQFNKTPPLNNHIDISMNHNTTHRPNIIPLDMSPTYIVSNNSNSSAGSPLSYSEYSNYYNFIRQPTLTNSFPYNNNYQPQRYTANIITQHSSAIPRSDPTKSMVASTNLNNLTVTLPKKLPKSNRITGKRANLPKETVKILNNWLENHLNNPYPTPAEKNELLKQTGLTKIQLSNWFINVRRRKVFRDHFEKI